MKKLTAMLLAAMLCVSGFLPVYAVEEAEEIDVIVVEDQYVQVDKELSAAEREKLIKLITEFGFEPEGIVCGIESQTDNQLLRAGAPDVLDSSEFKTEIVIQQLSVSGRKEYKLSAIGVWVDGSSPLFDSIKNDVFAIGWSDNFTIDTARGNNGFEAKTFYYNHVLKTTVQLENRAKLFDVALEAGGSYSVPLYVVEKSEGHSLWYIQLDAYIYKLATESGTANAMAKYAHAKKKNGISGVSFSPDSVSISFSGENVESVSEPAIISWDY